jgi:preprotein translocase subunit SecE
VTQTPDVTTTSERGGSDRTGRGSGTRSADRRRGGWFARLALFLRQVVAELRKVVWPTRKQLGTYTLVVIVFVGVLMAIVGGLDFGISKLVLWVFGN